jgi:hypothetical protein
MKYIFSVLGFIIGVAMYKQFDFENLSIENPALTIVYAIGLAISIYAVVKGGKKDAKS